MQDLGVVVIGRNEGRRLKACLDSLSCNLGVVPEPRGMGRIVYVDSGSTDDSVELARSYSAEVVELDMSRPFSAARARNEGLARLRDIAPDTRYVQFVDGDCAVVNGWIDVAVKHLDEQPQCAAVAGRLRERYPEHSLYNRLCDIEWEAPVGDVKACGGIAMHRISAFEQAGRFDESVLAGEEPELCLRLRKCGWKIRRLDMEMALHDAAMTTFRQWWKRAVRGGYGGSDVSFRFERGTGSFSRQIRSARLWGIGWPLTTLICGLTAFMLVGETAGVLAFTFLAAMLPLQILRLAARQSSRCGDLKTALAHGALTMVGKWAHLQGQYRYWRDRRSGRHLALIEHKAPVVDRASTV